MTGSIPGSEGSDRMPHEEYFQDNKDKEFRDWFEERRPAPRKKESHRSNREKRQALQEEEEFLKRQLENPHLTVEQRGSLEGELREVIDYIHTLDGEEMT